MDPPWTMMTNGTARLELIEEQHVVVAEARFEHRPERVYGFRWAIPSDLLDDPASSSEEIAGLIMINWSESVLSGRPGLPTGLPPKQRYWVT